MIRRVLIVLIVAALLLAAARYAIGFLPVSAGHCIEADFETLPADNERLIEWIRNQPGTLPHTVCAGRDGENASTQFLARVLDPVAKIARSG